MTPRTAIAIVPMIPNKRDWQWHSERIVLAWGKQVESIIETGRMLIDAKNELDHGSFEAMVNLKLPFGERTAQRLMVIADHPVLSKATHASLLPPSWATLYELTQVPINLLTTKLKDGSIHSKIERKDVRAMRPDTKSKPQSASRAELVAAIQKEPNANQRDAAAALGVSIGMYQRTRNELIGSGEISAPLTIDELRERMAAQAREMSKDQRMREVTKLMKALGLNIHDWVSTMNISMRRGN